MKPYTKLKKSWGNQNEKDYQKLCNFSSYMFSFVSKTEFYIKNSLNYTRFEPSLHSKSKQLRTTSWDTVVAKQKMLEWKSKLIDKICCIIFIFGKSVTSPWWFTKTDLKMDALRNILLAASSQDPRGLTNAEQQLKSLELQPGFHSALLVIFFLYLLHWILSSLFTCLLV